MAQTNDKYLDYKQQEAAMVDKLENQDGVGNTPMPNTDGGDSDKPIDVKNMAQETPTEKPVTPEKSEYKPPADADDLSSLWLDPALGDGLVDTHHHEVPIGKPKNFFRVNSDPAYRRRTEIYTHKIDGMIDEQHFIIGPAMRKRFDEATPCTLVTVIYRDGTPRIWPLKLPKDGGRDNEAWSSARSAARAAMDRWVKLVWAGRAYLTRDAQPGYAPDPTWSKLPPFDDLIRQAFGEHGIIRDENHPIARYLLGAKPKGDDDDGLS